MCRRDVRTCIWDRSILSVCAEKCGGQCAWRPQGKEQAEETEVEIPGGQMLIWFLLIRPTSISVSGNILACRWKLAWLVQDFSLLLSLLKTHCSSCHCLRAYSSIQLLLFLDITIKGSGYHKYSFIIVYINMFSFNFDSYMKSAATSNIRYIIFLKMDNCSPYGKSIHCMYTVATQCWVSVSAQPPLVLAMASLFSYLSRWFNSIVGQTYLDTLSFVFIILFLLLSSDRLVKFNNILFWYCTVASGHTGFGFFFLFTFLLGAFLFFCLKFTDFISLPFQVYKYL